MKLKPILVFIIVVGCLCAIGDFASRVSQAYAAPPATITGTPNACPTPQSIYAFVNDQLYVLPAWEPETTPTRIFTPTPLAEASRTPSPTVRPSATGTATGSGCRAYVVKASLLNVRDQPNKTAKILRTLKLNDTVSLSTLPQDSVTDTEGTVWRKLCQEASYLSQSWVSVK